MHKIMNLNANIIKHLRIIPELPLYWNIFIIGLICSIIFIIITNPEKKVVVEQFSIKKLFKKAGNAIASGVTSAAHTVASGVTSTANTVASGVTSTANTVAHTVEDAAKKAAEEAQKAAEKAAEEAKKAAEKAIEEAKKVAELMNIERVFKDVMRELEKFFNMIETIPKELKNVGNDIKGVANSAIKGVADAAGKVEHEMKDLGSSIAGELKNVENVIGSIPDTFEKKLKFPGR
jgi:hypothetical protein